METHVKAIISVIIPTFNRGHLIKNSLESVKNQTIVDWECIIVDDGSTDNTKESISDFLKDSRFKYFNRPQGKKKGADSCRNYGLELAEGQYINFLDSDDSIYPAKFEKQLNAFMRKDRLDVVLSKCDYFFEDRKVTYNIVADDPYRDFLARKIKWPINAPLWRKSFLAENKISFHEDLSCGQDWDFHLRAILSSPQIYYLKDVLCGTIKSPAINRIGSNKDLQYLINLSYSRKFIYHERIANTVYKKQFKKYMQSFIKSKLFILSRYRFNYLLNYINDFDLTLYQIASVLSTSLVKSFRSPGNRMDSDS